MDKQNVVWNGNYSENEGNSIIYYNTMNLKDFMLSKVSQSQKDKYCITPFTWGTWSTHNYKDRKYNGVD